MQPSRNESCRCGSGVKFKHCCGRLLQSPPDPAGVSHPIPYAAGALPLACCGYENIEKSLFDLLRRGNLAQAEILLRDRVAHAGDSAQAQNCLGWIAAAVGLRDAAASHFARAVALAPAWQQARSNLTAMRRSTVAADTAKAAAGGGPTKFLLIKAWGFGFWSDVAHVLGQLLIAELTGRTPVVHWGANSLFWDGTLQNAFDAYFEAVSAAATENLRDERFTIWPPKWNHRNLLDGEVDKWRGAFSRVAGFYSLAREERIVVSDFFSSVCDLSPWIPKSSELSALSLDELHHHLLRKYLRPRSEILAAVNGIYESRLAPGEYLAVHARGSDKSVEVRDLEAVNREYRRAIEEFRTRHGLRKIFLMTDDSRLREYFLRQYGDDVICTDCQRTDTARGVHYDIGRDRRLLGTEVMIDAYLALRAKAFIGNGQSNPSLMVRYLKPWPAEQVRLIGGNMYERRNLYLHNW
jgi:hypothetical protein